MVSDQFIQQQRNFFQTFATGAVYRCCVQQDVSNDYVLHAGKIQLFGLGFIVDECKDLYPLEFYLQSKDFNEQTAEIILKGKLKAVDKEGYFLSMELVDKPDKFLKIGYNGSGDEVHLIIRDTISVQENYTFEGKVSVQRSPYVYFLVKSNDKKYLCNGITGDLYRIKLAHQPHRYVQIIQQGQHQLNSLFLKAQIAPTIPIPTARPKVPTLELISPLEIPFILSISFFVLILSIYRKNINSVLQQQVLIQGVTNICTRTSKSL